MEAVLFLKMLEKVISVAVKMAGDAAWNRLRREERVINFLQKIHLDRPTADFESLYAHSLASFAAEGRQKDVLSLFRDQVVIDAFRVAWSEGTPSTFSQAFRRVVDALAAGDRLKALGLNVSHEIAAFQAVFKDMVQSVRSPSDQELMSIMLGPRMDAELQEIFDKTEEECRDRRCQMTRLHLLHRLLQSRIDKFKEPLRTDIRRVLDVALPSLYTGAFLADGFRMTDQVRLVRSTARRVARDCDKPEITVDIFLDCLLQEPGQNAQDLLRRHGLAAGTIGAALGFRSAPVDWQDPKLS
jgi:hypothetical protein